MSDAATHRWRFTYPIPPFSPSWDKSIGLAGYVKDVGNGYLKSNKGFHSKWYRASIPLEKPFLRLSFRLRAVRKLLYDGSGRWRPNSLRMTTS